MAYITQFLTVVAMLFIALLWREVTKYVQTTNTRLAYLRDRVIAAHIRMDNHLNIPTRR